MSSPVSGSRSCAGPALRAARHRSRGWRKAPRTRLCRTGSPVPGTSCALRTYRGRIGIVLQVVQHRPMARPPAGLVTLSAPPAVLDQQRTRMPSMRGCSSAGGLSAADGGGRGCCLKRLRAWVGGPCALDRAVCWAVGGARPRGPARRRVVSLWLVRPAKATAMAIASART